MHLTLTEHERDTLADALLIANEENRKYANLVRRAYPDTAKRFDGFARDALTLWERVQGLKP